VGLPASGKSTFAKELSKRENAKILSSDQMRLELYGDVNDQEHNHEIFQELHRRAKQHLKSNQNVILDATNISTKKRMDVLQGLKDYQKEVYYFDTPFERCVERDMQRSRTVGERVIDRMYRQLQIPTYAEGWDKIHFVHYEDPSEFKLILKKEIEKYIIKDFSYKHIFERVLRDIKIFDRILEFPHDSKYHSLSVSRHTYHVWKKVVQSYSDDLVLLWAALLHDTGKYHCKEFKEEDSRYANFLGHEFVSAQLTCQFLNYLGYDDEFILKVVELVQWHMRLMGAGDSEKAIKKLRDFVGEEVFEKLSILYDADLKAK
jgi:putative nucleotidyltransferase with HDIG domain